MQTAATKDEALTLAIGAAENLMKALKLSSDPDEKKHLKSQCGILMDVADRIKTSSDWTPFVRQPKTTKDMQIGQWAANIEVSSTPGPSNKEAASLESSSVYSLSQNAPLAETRSASGNSPFSSNSFSLQSILGAGLYPDDRQPASTPLIDLSEVQSSPTRKHDLNANADLRCKARSMSLGDRSVDAGLLPRAPSVSKKAGAASQHLTSSTLVAATASGSMTPVAPKLASPSHIHRLTEPVSTRRRSKKEDIILLKASVVNGFKCPPWNGTPAPTDFTTQNGQDLFM